MELTISEAAGDKVIATPTVADIEAALQVTGFSDDWALTLDDPDGPTLDALWEDGHFVLRLFEGQTHLNAVPNPDAGTLKTVYARFLAGDAGWRDQCQWETPADTKKREKARAAEAKAAAQAVAAQLPKPTPAPWWQRLIALAAVLFAGIVGYRVWTQGLSFITDVFPAAQPQLALLSGGMGIVALLMFIAMHHASKQAQSWPHVTGKVLRSQVVRYTEGSGDGHRTPTYTPAIDYAYTVNGFDYKSSQRELNMTSGGSMAWAEKIAAKYPVGSAVDVHYDPANPATAALANSTGKTWLVFAFAAFCMGMSVYVLHPLR